MGTPLFDKIREREQHREPPKVTKLVPVWRRRLEAKDLTAYVNGAFTPDGSERGA